MSQTKQEGHVSASLDRLSSEFDRWARDGRGEGMEEGHLAVTRIIVQQMPLLPDSHVLDLGCGTGWATRLLATRLEPLDPPEDDETPTELGVDEVALSLSCRGSLT